MLITQMYWGSMCDGDRFVNMSPHTGPGQDTPLYEMASLKKVRRNKTSYEASSESVLLWRWIDGWLSSTNRTSLHMLR